MSIVFTTDDAQLGTAFQNALTGLRDNLHPLPVFDRPVLWEGAAYRGIWLECGPLEGLLYGTVNPEIALDCHRLFFALQKEDGQFPCLVRATTGVGWAQIQMVVPIAATAWETYELTGSADFLQTAYTACARWDEWLARHRNTRGTGGCELFCEYDSGHDNSPRFAPGFPKECAERDARRLPDFPGLPYVAPDLTATVYGGRVALARMARLLNLDCDAVQWDDKAEGTRAALLTHCYDEETECFYDRDAGGQFVRVCGDALTRVLSEHAVDQTLFDRIFARHIHNPAAFWTPYPLPSVAADDPQFVRDLPQNSWGGASQALTALRAPRWLGFYGRHAALSHLMGQWMDALVRGGFRQQIHPWTGDWTPAPDGYSPAMLCLLEFTARLHGVRREGGALEWNCRLPARATQSSYQQDAARLTQNCSGATLTLEEKTLASVQGACRVVTTAAGVLTHLVGTAGETVNVTLTRPGQPPQEFTLALDAVFPL